MLLFRLALRKSELAAIQFKHLGHDRKRLRVYGKGGTMIPVPVPDVIRQELAKYLAAERPNPSDYLRELEIPPKAQELRDRRVPRFMHRRVGRDAMCDDAGVLQAAIPPPTATRAHASIQTTADIYAHLDDADLERALARMEPIS